MVICPYFIGETDFQRNYLENYLTDSGINTIDKVPNIVLEK
jgi:hypothetical protein